MSPTTQAASHLDLVSGVFWIVRELRRQITELMAEEPWAVEAGIRPPGLGVITVISRFQPVSQRQISDWLGLDASDVVGVLDNLQGSGLVERRRDPLDRRRHAVVLTAKGEKVAARVATLRAAAADRVLVALDPAQRAELATLVAVVTADPTD